jgi:Skp family chaperone for outer membrane proteins
MKMIFVLLSFLLAPAIVPAQTAESVTMATTLAALRNAEENLHRLTAEVQNLIDTQEMIRKRQERLQQRLDSFEAEVRALKSEFTRANASGISREEFRELALKLREIDDKRESDKQLILKNIRELAKVPVAPPSDTRPPRRAPDTGEAPFEYTVKKGDRLLDIIAAYNVMFEERGQGSITLDDVTRANPSLKNPNNLRTGQKIFVPVPQR